MQLVLPSVQYKDSFIQAVKEYQADEADDRLDVLSLRVEDLEHDFDSYVSQLLSNAEGKNLLAGYVPQSTFWLVDGNEFIGRTSIRHILTDRLLREGGHIGYDIRPSMRQKGYGKRMLELALPRAKALGIKRALVTCNEDNLGSKKIIEANGGVFENAVSMGEGKPRKLRYWITI